MSTPEEVKRARTLRRRHKHERQALIFGVLIAALTMTGLGAYGIWSGTIDAPFDRAWSAKVTKKDPITPQPCLPDNVLPVAAKDITINVYNAAEERDGLAGQVKTGLANRAFAIGEIGTSDTKLADVRIAFGRDGLAQAYTLAAHFPNATFFYDDRADATIDLFVGDNYDKLLPVEEVPLVADKPMTSVNGCSAIDKLTPAPRVVPVTPKDDATTAPAEEQPAG